MSRDNITEALMREDWNQDTILLGLIEQRAKAALLAFQDALAKSGCFFSPAWSDFVFVTLQSATNAMDDGDIHRLGEMLVELDSWRAYVNRQREILGDATGLGRSLGTVKLALDAYYETARLLYVPRAMALQAQHNPLEALMSALQAAGGRRANPPTQGAPGEASDKG